MTAFIYVRPCQGKLENMQAFTDGFLLISYLITHYQHANISSNLKSLLNSLKSFSNFFFHNSRSVNVHLGLRNSSKWNIRTSPFVFSRIILLTGAKLANSFSKELAIGSLFNPQFKFAIIGKAMKMWTRG